jgi:DNA/RNA-binding domain of Phe-tRNA-synthetase-like protein
MADPFARRIDAEPHPLLRHVAFVTMFPSALGQLPSPQWLTALLRDDAEAPLAREEELRIAVRDLLRLGGYKPTGRGKPSAEYLSRAAQDGSLSSINLAVDACNVVSLHSGFPISLIDLDRAKPPFRIAIATPGDRYVFNASGQEIELSGLLCLFDAEGPCANAVKDSQRTKTNGDTRRTLSIIWGVQGHEERLERAVAWYRGLLGDCNAATTPDTGRE